MALYVDELFTMVPRTAQARKHGSRWCHLTTDGDLEELHAFAKRLGLKRSHFQARSILPHYDLVPSKRALAVQFGAVETTTMKRIQQERERRGAI